MAGDDQPQKEHRHGRLGRDWSPVRAGLAFEEMERNFTRQADRTEDGRFVAIDKAYQRIAAAVLSLRLPLQAQLIGVVALCFLILLGGTLLFSRMATPHPPMRPVATIARAPARDLAPALPPRAAPVAEPAVIPAAVPAVAPAPGAGGVPTDAAAQAAAQAETAQSARRAEALRRASRKLADAYASALGANVDPQYLALYSQRWSALRQEAATDPDGTAAAYEVMTRELDRLAQDATAPRPR